MAIVLRFVDKDGFIHECFFDLVQVKDISALIQRMEYLMFSLVIALIFKIFADKDIMVLVTWVMNGMDYKHYFLTIVLVHTMFIVLLID
jgi:hypothetical protein